jgi:hypothetical protein
VKRVLGFFTALTLAVPFGALGCGQSTEDVAPRSVDLKFDRVDTAFDGDEKVLVAVNADDEEVSRFKIAVSDLSTTFDVEIVDENGHDGHMSIDVQGDGTFHVEGEWSGGSFAVDGGEADLASLSVPPVFMVHMDQWMAAMQTEGPRRTHVNDLRQFRNECTTVCSIAYTIGCGAATGGIGAIICGLIGVVICETFCHAVSS